MSTALRFSLPLPPTANNLYAIVNNRKVKSKEARDYEGLVLSMIEQRCIPESAIPTPPLALEVHLYLKYDRDVDGLKALQDSIAKALGFNDKVIEHLCVWKHRDPDAPGCEIALSEIEGVARQPRLAG